MRQIFNLTMLIMLATTNLAQAQEIRIEDLKKNISILSGVIEEALELNVSPTLFGINVGQVSGLYLHNQGVMLDIRSPLANQRNRMSLGALVSSIDDLQFSANPFALAVVPENSPAPASRELAAGENIDEFRKSLVDQINSLDISSAINSSLRQISQYTRSLNELGELNEDDLQLMRESIDKMRDTMQSQSIALREFERTVRAGPDELNTSVDATQRSSLQQNIEKLRIEIERLRLEAVDKAAELQQRNEQARLRYAEQWREKVLVFEYDLFATLCDYAATLRELPDNEFVTLVLRGLGNIENEGVMTDKIHVVRKPELLDCQSGEIDAASLMQGAASYSY